MKKFVLLTLGMVVLASLLFCFVTVPTSQAQTKDEKQFMKQHEKEMTTFMEKCSGCHSLQRILAKKKSKEDWDKIVKMMAGKPHANISDQDMKNIEKWIGFMQSAFIP